VQQLKLPYKRLKCVYLKMQTVCVNPVDAEMNFYLHA